MLFFFLFGFFDFFAELFNIFQLEREDANIFFGFPGQFLGEVGKFLARLRHEPDPHIDGSQHFSGRLVILEDQADIHHRIVCGKRDIQ